MVAESEKAARNGPQSRFSNAVRNRWSATATAAESWTARSAAAPPIGVIDWPRSAGGDARVARNTESIVRRNGAQIVVIPIERQRDMCEAQRQLGFDIIPANRRKQDLRSQSFARRSPHSKDPN